MGRKPYTVDNLPKTWKKDMLDLASEGAGIVELAVKLGVNRDTITALAKRDEDFKDTLKKSRTLCENWWEQQGRKNLDNKQFNYVGWYMNMKNRFGWRDRQDITTKDKELPQPILGGLSKKK